MRQWGGTERMAGGVGAVIAVVASKTKSLGFASAILIAAAIALASCGRLASSPGPISPSVAPPLQGPQAACPITRAPQPPFIPPPPYSIAAPGSQIWFGSPALWTAIASSGTWPGLPYESGSYVQKVFWWRDGYDWRSEPTPQLSVTGFRIDGPAKPLEASAATNAFGTDIGSSMLVLIHIPTSGCWNITGQYKDASLTFVVWVPA